ncbi:MAG: lipopolysaccharide heptosyltransferase [Deltaproteobacteria bacterium]|nr:lipopolysaccharide heptosyltransferase [Deltaproteobacteria bacterium]
MAGSLLGQDLRSIAVFMLRHIGDTLLSTPTFHALRAAFPSARILAVVNEGTQEMLEGNPDIDDILVFDRRRRNEGGFGRWKEEAALVRSLRSFRAGLAVNLTEGDRGAILSVLSGARHRVGVTPNRKGFLGKEVLFTHLCGPHDRYRHAVLRDLDVVAAAGIPPADLRLRLPISDEDREKSARILRGAGIPAGHPFSVVQPTSRWTFKCWTEDGMAGVISHLADLGFAPVVTSGPAPVEVAQAERIRERAGERAVSLAGRLSLKELGGVIASARLFVGVDSAPMHVSAAVRTPTVALFGPTGAFNWAPWEGVDWGYSAQRKGGTRFVGRHAVVQQEWDCVPCGKDGCGGTKRSRCMEEISLDQVTEAIDRVLAGAAGSGIGDAS